MQVELKFSIQEVVQAGQVTQEAELYIEDELINDLGDDVHKLLIQEDIGIQIILHIALLQLIDEIDEIDDMGFDLMQLRLIEVLDYYLVLQGEIHDEQVEQVEIGDQVDELDIDEQVDELIEVLEVLDENQQFEQVN